MLSNRQRVLCQAGLATLAAATLTGAVLSGVAKVNDAADRMH